MQIELNKIKESIASDINTTIEKNLSKYLNQVTENDNLLDNLKQILFKLPEYQNLIQENIDLKYQIVQLKNKLEESTTKNIKLNINEIESKNTSTEDLTILKLNNENIIENCSEILLKNVQEEEEEEEEEEEDEEEEEEEEDVDVDVEDEEEDEDVEEEEEKDEDEEDEEDEDVEEEEDEDEEEEEEEDIELLEVIVDNKQYFMNELTNDIYSSLNGEPDNLIGKYRNKKIIYSK